MMDIETRERPTFLTTPTIGPKTPPRSLAYSFGALEFGSFSRGVENHATRYVNSGRGSDSRPATSQGRKRERYRTDGGYHCHSRRRKLRRVREQLVPQQSFEDPISR